MRVSVDARQNYVFGFAGPRPAGPVYETFKDDRRVRRTQQINPTNGRQFYLYKVMLFRHRSLYFCSRLT